jgi:ribosomal protein S12 methylthiotransferase accessory factor
MIDKPIFAPSFRVEIVDAEGVFLLSERGHFVLKGPLHSRLASLIDGSHTADEIVDILAGDATPPEVYFALERLERKGYIVDADSDVTRERAAFWHSLRLDPQRAERRLRESKVSVAYFGNVPTGLFEPILASLGIQVSEEGGLTVVLTDDYLQDGLDDFNTRALVSGRPWLLVKPQGTILWIGPTFRPGTTACWECLAHRLRANREVESYLNRQNGARAPVVISQSSIPAVAHTAFHIAALETAKAILLAEDHESERRLVTLDVLALEMRTHTLIRRPQCTRCGTRTFFRDREAVPLALKSRRKRFTADGGHRTISPEQTFARYERHIGPITGAVRHVSRVSVGDDHSLHVYVAGQNVSTHHNSSLTFLRHGLRSKSGGKGTTDAQARTSALCEALERYSGNFQGDEIRRTATYRRLGARAMHPNNFLNISEAQYQRRHEWNVQASRFHRIPDPLDEEVEIEWTPVWSLTHETFKYLPTSYCYYGYPSSPTTTYCWADSNGNAAGNTIEEAILHGFMELAERDGVCLWWYNRVRRPGVDLDSFDEPYLQALREHYRKLNRDLWALDLTSDLGIPTFAAISRRTDSPDEEIILGFGSHFEQRIAVLRALTELNQYFPLLSAVDCDDRYAYANREQRHWWNTARLENQPHLTPDIALPSTRACNDVTWSDDLYEDVLCCQRIVQTQGLEMLVLDQTRPDIGLPVVKVIVPGMRHFWVRLGAGRLYDVPVKLGWVKAPLAENQLNPIPMFI